jgi:photosystem II stability/assembly factor-like uncharacterized protein
MRRVLRALFVLALLPASLLAQRTRVDSTFLSAFRWRSIGPANMSGRVSGIAGNPRNPKEIFAAFATGGIWKTVNAGTTWTPVFDNTGVHTVSEVSMAPSDTSILWAGTGEEDSRNSISPGNGVYKSTDGGRSWTSMGLRETQVIGRIVIHPTDPNTVWVAALGHAWGRNPERGIYKTTDGGQTWRLVKFVSDRAGAVDLAIDPANPSHLLASFWERQRGPYYLQSGGQGSGLWATGDGGQTWAQVAGNGLPGTTWGRSGVAFAPSNPSIVYALVEADSAPNPASVRAARQRGFQPDTTKRARLESGLFRSADGGRTWERMNRENNRPFYYSQLMVDPRNPDRLYWLSTQARYSNDAGRTYRTVGQGVHTDYHAIWIDPNDPDHYILGQDGGLAQTFDRGRTYDAIFQMAVGQFYAVSADMQRPFWVCGGLQDNGSWCGPSESPRGRIMNQDWANVGGGDGFYTAQDPSDPDIVYSESQGGAIQRTNLRTWERRSIRPGTVPTASGGFAFGLPISRILEDSLILARGDTTLPVSPAQQHVLDSLNARIAADTAMFSRSRFNWDTPFFISTHNPRTLYMGGQRLFKTVDRGEHWIPISEDLSTRDTMKIHMSLELSGGVTRDVSAAETHGTITTVSESPARAGILWAGTDDGNVWLTRNDGGAWENLTARFTGVPRGLWVSRVAASKFDSATVYVTFDGHRSDDYHPYVFVSSDFGRTFRSLASGLPATEYVHVITEDPRRRGLLFLGTELTAYVSTDSGATWRRFNGGLPPAPVHDLLVHPRDQELIAGTHGRSIWMVDIGPLEQATDSVLSEPAHLFAPDVALLYTPRAGGGGVGSVGSKVFSAPNGTFGARLALRITQGDTSTAPALARGPGGAEGRGARAAGAAGAAPAAGAAEADTSAGAPGGGPGGFGGGSMLNQLVSALMGGGGGGGFGGGGFAAPRSPGDSVTVVITDAGGDTVRTLYTSARNAALRFITWDLRRNRAPLGPAALRDSIRTAQRRTFLTDSVRTAMRDTTGGRRSMPMRDPTPGEPGVPMVMIGDNWGLLPSTRGGGGFGGGAGALVDPGTYLVTVRFSGHEYRQTVRVERPSEQQSALSGGWQ